MAIASNSKRNEMRIKTEKGKIYNFKVIYMRIEEYN